MTKRQVVIDALKFRKPAYVPWAWSMTIDCRLRLQKYLGREDLGDFTATHFLDIGQANLRVASRTEGMVKDVYGVTWDCTVDKDIGTPSDWPIKEHADLKRYRLPDPSGWTEGDAKTLATGPDLFRRFTLGFTLFERAWTLRGMENLLMDMIEAPAFVEDFMDAIVEHNLILIRKALDLDIDCLHFGDDYGMQNGLIMGGAHWRKFIKPRLARMFKPVRDAGKFVSMHSCGCVGELFDDLVEIGLQVFNPFQPEVMDVFDMMKKYHGRLAFHGGMSVQKVLPFGTVADVRQMTRDLIQAGSAGGYIFSPSHSVPRDVPPENLVAMMEELKAQPGYAAVSSV